MTLKILELRVADFMSPRPITVKDSYGFLDSIQIMVEKGIGNLVVVKNRHPVGILTERQILEHITTYGKIKNVKLDKIKISPFQAIDITTRIVDAAKMMIKKKNRLLVFDEKRFLGIITATDIVRAFGRTHSNPSLSKVSTKKIYAVNYDDIVLKAVKLMHKKRIGSVIVMKNKEPYGIFTERDLLVNVLANDVDVENYVGGYCSYPLVTASLNARAGDASKIMSENKIKRLALTKNKKIKAIVTARDIVDAFQASFSNDE